MKVLVLLLIGVSAQVLAQDELSQRIAAFEACLSDAAQQLDDGITPAPKVARIVAGECLSEWDRFLRLTADGALPRRVGVLGAARKVLQPGPMLVVCASNARELSWPI